MRIESVEYEDGSVYVFTDEGIFEQLYLPAIIVDKRFAEFIDADGLAVKEHRYALELRGTLDALISVQRELSRITSAYLFIEPERQFLLDKGISYHSLLSGNVTTLGLPSLSKPEEALEFLLRSKYGYPPRVFVENVLFRSRVAADLSLVERHSLPPEALDVLLRLRLSPEGINFDSGILLPSSRVRISTDIPFSFSSIDPLYRSVYGDAAVAGPESQIPLADAVLLGVEYHVVRPVYSAGGALPSAVLSLLHMFKRMFERVRPRGRTIVDVALHSSSPSVVSAYSYISALSAILLPLPSFLASTNTLSIIGRSSFVAGWEMYRRSPKVYSYLYPSSAICSPDSNVLEYFLHALSSLPSELLLQSKFRRA